MVGSILEADFSVEMKAGSPQGNPLSSLFAQFLFQPVLDEVKEVMGPKLATQSAFADNMDWAMQCGHVEEFMRESQRLLVEMTG
jgi:hypothetical protein